MASVNARSREVVFKIVYYGPGLGGKTTTLERLHATTRPEHRGKLVSLATPVDRTLYFDYLPLRLPPIRGMNVRLQLFTVPGQVYFNATRKLVLTGADGVVFVSDSQSARADANVDSVENLRENLVAQGRSIDAVPLVFQHNKRDLSDLLSMEELDRLLNPRGVPSIPSSARSGEGVYEALEKITEEVLRAFRSRLPEMSEGEPAVELLSIEDGLVGGLMAALRDASPTVSPEDIVVARIPDPERPDGVSMPEETHTADPPPPAEVKAEGAPARAPEAAMPQEPALAASAKKGFSFAELWPDGEHDAVREVEAAIASDQHARAVELSEALVARVLASTAGLFGASGAPRDPALLPLLLGLNGARYLAFRAIVRDARAGAPITIRDALAAYSFAIDARLSRSSLR